MVFLAVVVLIAFSEKIPAESRDRMSITVILFRLFENPLAIGVRRYIIRTSFRYIDGGFAYYMLWLNVCVRLSAAPLLAGWCSSEL